MNDTCSNIVKYWEKKTGMMKDEEGKSGIKVYKFITLFL